MDGISYYGSLEKRTGRLFGAAIFCWGHTHNGVKTAVKTSKGIKTAGKCDIYHFFVGIFKQIGCFVDSAAGYIVAVGQPGALMEVT